MAHDANAHLDTAAADSGVLSQYQKESEKGAANGYASLDASTLIPDAQIPATIARDSELHAEVHGDAQHPVMGRMQVIRKTADETIAATVILQDDNHLLFAVGANEVWAFQGLLIYNTSGVEDFKYAATGPSGSSGFIARLDAIAVVAPLGTESGSVNATTGSDMSVGISGVIENGGTAGNLQIRWAQFAAGVTDLTVREHSFLVAHRIA